MGVGLIVAGVLALIVGFVFDTTADGDVYNLGLLQYQMMIWNIGVGLAAAGLIIETRGQLGEKTERRDSGANEVNPEPDDDQNHDRKVYGLLGVGALILFFSFVYASQ